MATQSSILAQETPWTDEPGGPQSMGLQRVRHNLATQAEINPVYPSLSSSHSSLQLGDIGVSSLTWFIMICQDLYSVLWDRGSPFHVWLSTDLTSMLSWP